MIRTGGADDASSPSPRGRHPSWVMLIYVSQRVSDTPTRGWHLRCFHIIGIIYITTVQNMTRNKHLRSHSEAGLCNCRVPRSRGPSVCVLCNLKHQNTNSSSMKWNLFVKTSPTFVNYSNNQQSRAVLNSLSCGGTKNLLLLAKRLLSVLLSFRGGERKAQRRIYNPEFDLQDYWLFRSIIDLES